MKIISQIRNGGTGNGKRVSDGEIGLTYPLTVLIPVYLNTRLLFPTLSEIKGELISRGLAISNRCANMRAWMLRH